METMKRVEVLLDDPKLPQVDHRLLFGPDDHHITLIEEAFDVKAYINGKVVFVSDDKQKGKWAKRAFLDILFHLHQHHSIDVDMVASLIKAAGGDEHKHGSLSVLKIVDAELKIATQEQQTVWDNFHNKDINLVVGPAGTGKTFLGIGYAFLGLQEEIFQKVLIARPAVETSKSIGALPGDEVAKVSPYLRPIFDNVGYYIQDIKVLHKWIEDEIIEMNHVGFMRGRSIRNTCIVIDEAQNLTIEEAKMVVTRIAQGSKIILCGDVTQCDIKEPSGLKYLVERFQGDLKYIGTSYLTNVSNMRHKAVAEAVSLFEE